MSERDFVLERELRSLALAIEYPPQRDLTGDVMHRIEAEPMYRRGLAERSAELFRNVVQSLREPAFAATAVVVLASVFLVISPAARDAVADWLGFDDVRVTFGEPPVRPTPPVGGHLDLGDAVTLTEARRLVDFDVLVPSELGAPDEVYYEEFVSAGQISLVYRERDDLPPAPRTRVGAIVTQFEADFLDNDFYEKFVEGPTTVQEVTVSGVRGLWIDRRHAIIYRGADGREGIEESRLSGPSLIWEKDGIVYRLESNLPLDRAVIVAESLR
jgi:hypothetical protein